MKTPLTDRRLGRSAVIGPAAPYWQARHSS
jgi:hypothetical protein